VEIEGVVHAAHLTRSNVTIDLATAGGSLRATTVRELGVDYEAFVDSLIRLRGNAAPVFNWKEQMVGAQLIFPSLRNAKILEAAPHDPFAMTVVPFSQVIRFSPSEEIPHRVHVRGRVTLQWPGRKLCIQQGNDSLCLETAQTDRVREGSLVDAVGFPATSAYKETLENATFRPAVGANLAILARPVTADEALRGDYDGQLVQIQGQLVALEHLGGDLQLMLRSGGFLIPAVLPSNLAGAGTLPWKEGSILRLTGLCNSQAGTETWNLRNGEVQPGSIQVLLRSIEDVQIVELPSWWTPRHVLGILAVVGFGSLAAASWIVILRRRVDQQTMALRKSEERLRHLSQHDALTRLPNRILLNDRMDVALNRAERFHESVGLLMVDIDRFKETNDLYGHQAGDRLLCEVASRIKGSVRKTDTVARIGGDEFIVLLPDLHETEEAELIATKILAAVSSPIELGNVSVTTSVSIGVCTYPEGGTDSEALLQSADAAMYSAKASGRNAVQVTRPMNTLIH
jgi:diguanylate cyclase (GGDEF)-like protein